MKHRRLPMVLALPVLVAGVVTESAAVPCDLDVTLDVTPRMPMDGGVLTYTLEYCDTTGNDADVYGAFIGVSRNNFVPNSGVWLTCPRGGCGMSGPDGNMEVGGFSVAANECVTFEFTLQLQPGLGGQRVCLQGNSTVYSYNPPNIPFPCPKDTDDPLSFPFQDATCVEVEDPAPGCSLEVTVTPSFLATCAGSNETLTCDVVQTGCPGGALEYEWTRDGQPIPVTGRVITIPATEPPGGHQYRCIARCAALPACVKASWPVQVTLLGSVARITVDPTATCVNEDVDVSVSGATSCTIDCDNGTGPQTTCFRTCRYGMPGTYTLLVTTDDGNCNVTTPYTIDIFNQANACIDAITALCEDSAAGPTTVDLSSCSNAGLDHTWTTSLGSLSDPNAVSPTLTLPDVNVPTAVNLTLEVRDPGGCGAPDTTNMSFELRPSPVATAAAAPTPGCIDEDVLFTGMGAGTPGPFDYLWDFGDTSTSTMQNPAHRYAVESTYDVTLTVTDRGIGCAAVETFPLVIDVCNTCAAIIPEVQQVLGIKSPGVTGPDVALLWQMLVEAQDGYNVWAVTDKVDIPNAREPGGVGIRAVCRPTATESCIDPNALLPAADPLIFYQSRGLCGGTEGE